MSLSITPTGPLYSTPPLVIVNDVTFPLPSSVTVAAAASFFAPINDTVGFT